MTSAIVEPLKIHYAHCLVRVLFGLRLLIVSPAISVQQLSGSLGVYGYTN